jgi:hypothetical protein
MKQQGIQLDPVERGFKLDPLGKRGGNNPVWRGDYQIGCGRGESGSSPQRIVCCYHVYKKGGKWYDRFSGKRHRCSFGPSLAELPPPPIDWYKRLSPTAKLLILSAVLERLRYNRTMKKLPKPLQEFIRAADRDATIERSGNENGKDWDDLWRWFEKYDPTKLVTEWHVGF